MQTTHQTQDKGYKGIGMEGRIATWYANNTRKDIPEFRSLADRFSREIPANGRVLEVAPGPGYLSVELAQRGSYEVTGLDISETFVQIARKNAREASAKVKFVRGNASAMPFEVASFDLILCRAAFKNFSQPIEALNEMHRVLKPGGRAVIIDLRRDAKMKDINNYIRSADLSWKDKMMYRLTFRFLLIPRASTREQWIEMAQASKFGALELGESGIGFEISLRKKTS